MKIEVWEAEGYTIVRDENGSDESLHYVVTPTGREKGPFRGRYIAYRMALAMMGL